jgi:UDP-glucose 4-epimerase
MNNLGKIIVFGATGTLGTYLVDDLVSQGFDVCAVGRRNVKKGYYDSKGVESFDVDIANSNDFSVLPKDNIYAVIQISGAMPSRMLGYSPNKYLEVNTLGTLNVLEYTRKVSAQKYLFTQSHSDVAGHWNTGKKISPYAERKLNLKGDHAVYIVSKNAAVDLVEHYHLDYGIDTYVFRLPTIYSYRDIEDMFVNGKSSRIGYRYLINRALKSETIEIWGNPKVEKDIVYVKDFTQMLIKSLTSSAKKGVYNVATGTATTLETQVLEMINIFSPKENPSKVVYREDKPSQNSYLYDISNAVSDLGYCPEYNYARMLEDMKLEIDSGRFNHLADVNNTI